MPIMPNIPFALHVDHPFNLSSLSFPTISIWMDQYYYVFGFTLIVAVILIVTCAEITMVLIYFQLCNEDYNWWWRSFLASGSTALYMFL